MNIFNGDVIMIDYEIIDDEWEPQIGDKVRVKKLGYNYGIPNKEMEILTKKIGKISNIYYDNEYIVYSLSLHGSSSTIGYKIEFDEYIDIYWFSIEHLEKV